MWTRKAKQGPEAEAVENQVGGDFENAAARVTAAVPESEEEKPNATAPAEAAAAPEEKLIVKPEWALAATKACFWPPAKFIHPAYALQDAEAVPVVPPMQKALQALADKIAPMLLVRLSNRYPEFWDLLAALGLLYIQKYNYVSAVIKKEEEDRVANAKPVTGERVDEKSDTAKPSNAFLI